MSNSLYWHDYETWGEVPALDRPVQFAGVRTDEDLNIIGDPLMIYCRPAPDLLPKPEACLITGITPQLALEKGLPEYEFVARVHAELSMPGTCGVGYNSIRFDDEVTRYALYRNFYDPYEREWRNGNSRWDIIDMVRMARALRPEGIVWPDYDDGLPCFRLEMLSAANGLVHEAAHDALSDVYATIALARLIKTRQPKLYDYAYKLRDKRFASGLIDIANRKPLLHISSRFAGENGNSALMLPLAIHPANRNSIIAYNLAIHPADLLELPVEELRLRLFTRTEDLPEGQQRLALKEIHLNKTPMLLPLGMLDDATCQRLRLDRELCEKHWQIFHELGTEEQRQLLEKLHALYSELPFAERTDPEQMLYAGFFDEEDRKLINRVRRMSPAQLANAEWPFKDSRLPELLFRFRARNFPDSLSPSEMARWQRFLRSRLEGDADDGSLGLQQLRERIAVLDQGQLSEEQKTILKELLTYADSLIAQ